MESSTPNMALGDDARYMQASDWAAHRSQIIQLYREDKKTLQQTRNAIQAEHGLKATDNMWKKKITEWGLNKKNRKKEILAILRKKQQRDSVGKKTIFKLRGREVDLKDVHRYAARNHISETTIAELVLSHPDTPPDLQCLSPEPILNTMARRGVSDVQERVLQLFNHYLVGTFEQRIWRATSDGLGILLPGGRNATGEPNQDALSRFYTSIINAKDALMRNETKAAVLCLSAASAMIRKIVRTSWVTDIAKNIYHMSDITDNRAFSILIQHNANMARLLLPHDDPRCQIYCLLSQLSREPLSSLAPLISRCCADGMERFVGEFHASAISGKIYALRRREEHEAILCWGAEFLAKWEPHWKPYDIRTVFIYNQMAISLMRVSNFEAAKNKLEEVLRRISNCPRNYLLEHPVIHYLAFHAYRYLGWICWQQGDERKSVELLEHALRIAEKESSEGDVLYVLGELEEFLSMIGERDEARHVRARRIAIFERYASL